MLLTAFNCSAFERVIIWGHPHYSHTHSYIHYAFYKTFKAMGYKTYWASKLEELKGVPLENSLFLTEGKVDKHMPKRTDCDYILHNIDFKKYQGKIDSRRAITIQVFTTDVLTRPNLEEIEPYLFFGKEDKILYMPWATDLLPKEIDKNKDLLKRTKKKHFIRWVGTLTRGTHSNYNQIMDFVDESRIQN